MPITEIRWAKSLYPLYRVPLLILLRINVLFGFKHEVCNSLKVLLFVSVISEDANYNTEIPRTTHLLLIKVAKNNDGVGTPATTDWWFES